MDRGHLNAQHTRSSHHIPGPLSIPMSVLNTQRVQLSMRTPSQQNIHSPHPAAYFPHPPGGIDVDVLAAGVQLYMPAAGTNSHHGSGGNPGNGDGNGANANSNAYIHLPPGIDPSTVDFRTFYPYNPSEVKHRKRTTRQQLKILEETFKRETKPNASLRKTLASQLEMTPRGVQVWFQNRRAKEKSLAKKVNSADHKPSINLGAADCDDDADIDLDIEAATELDLEQDDDLPVDSRSKIQNRTSLVSTASSSTGSSGASTGISNSAGSVCSTPPMDSGATASSSTSSTSVSVKTSPESTPPTLPRNVDIAPPATIQVSSPPEDAKRHTSPAGLGVSRTSWHGQHNQHQAQGENMPTRTTPVPMEDDSSLLAMRRPSLPTHLGTGLPSPRASPLGLGMVNGPPSAYRMRNASHCGSLAAPRRLSSDALGLFDPAARRLSLDRLAKHPYARLALRANELVYGPEVIRASTAASHLPIGPKSQQHAHILPHSFLQQHQQQYHPAPPLSQIQDVTPTHGTPQAHRAELPQDTFTQMGTESSVTSGDVGIQFRNPFDTTQSQTHGSLLVDAQTDPRSALESLGPVSAGATNDGHFPPYRMRFPREGHVYSFAARNQVAPVIPGPLPNPDFSFGSPEGNDNGGPGAAGGVSVGSGGETGQNQGPAHIQAYSFPGHGVTESENGGTDGMGNRNVDGEDELQPPAFGPYQSRFGSIASIAESESSIASGFYSTAASDVGSSFDLRPSTGHSLQGMAPQGRFNDGRRPSYTGQMLDMFSNLDVHNGSAVSLAHSHHSREISRPETSPGNMGNMNAPTKEASSEGVATAAYPSPSSTVSAGSNDMHNNPQVASSHSELAFALQPSNGQQQQHAGTSADVMVHNGPRSGGIQSESDSVSYSSGSHNTDSHRSSLSGSSSLMYPLSTSASSASSSSSSLGVSMPPPPAPATHKVLDEIDMDFLRNFDAVSETGHYSPVSHHSSTIFDLPQPLPNGPMGMGASHSGTGGYDNTVGMMGHVPSTYVPASAAAAVAAHQAHVMHQHHPHSQPPTPMFAEEHFMKMHDSKDGYLQFGTDALRLGMHVAELTPALEGVSPFGSYYH